MIPQYQTPNNSRPNPGMRISSRACVYLHGSSWRADAAHRPSLLPEPSRWNENKLGAVSQSTPIEAHPRQERLEKKICL